jgi:hypothetical protein
MKQILLFTLSFLAVSLALTWLWLAGGNALYAETMQPIAREIHQWVGLRRAGTMDRARFINLVPFVTLMLLTPRLSRRRRWGGLAIGLLILVLSHLLLNAIAVGSHARGRLPPTAALASDAMPFLIWFVIAREFVQKAIRKVRNQETPRSDEEA